MKKRGFGKDKFNGFGGKVADKEEFKDESIEESLKREGREEFGIEILTIKKCAEFDYVFPHDDSWGQSVHVYICTKWNGEPKESEEMKPVWFKISEIPYNRMWDDDKYWIPQVLAGEKLKGTFEFDKDGITTSSKLERV